MDVELNVYRSRDVELVVIGPKKWSLFFLIQGCRNSWLLIQGCRALLIQGGGASKFLKTSVSHFYGGIFNPEIKKTMKIFDKRTGLRLICYSHSHLLKKRRFTIFDASYC